MHRSTFQRLVALMCALVFTLNTAVMARTMVVCQNAEGASRLEWGCAKDTAGHCADSCENEESDLDGDDHHSESAPCSDAPISSQPCTSNRAAHQPQTPKAFDLSLVHFAIVQATPSMKSAEIACALPTIRPSPPPEWSLLRTIILLV